MIGIYHSHTARIALAITYKGVVRYQVALAMTQSHHAFTLPEVIAAHDVVARLDRYHFHLTRASVKEIVTNRSC
jgi:acetylornithine deacetylase/succinyl-diaminopimelate desuccinylase-like protein